MGNKNRENPKFSIKGKMKALIFSSWNLAQCCLQPSYIQPYGMYSVCTCTEASVATKKYLFNR